MPNDSRPRARIALLGLTAARAGAVQEWLAGHEPAFETVAVAPSWAGLVHDPAFPTDLVVMAARLPGPIPVESRVRTCRASGTRVIVHTEVEDADGARSALAAGAAACLYADQPPYEVATVLRAVAGIALARPAGASTPDPGPKLSDGERRALVLYVAGLTTKQVAYRMNVRYETAKTYLRRARRKYAAAGRAAGTRAELQRRAFEDGVLS